MTAQSKMYLWWDMVVFYLTLPEIREHAHHPVQITWGLDGPFEASVNGEAFQTHNALLTAPDVPHALKLIESDLFGLMIFPETAAGRALITQMLVGRDSVPLPGDQFDDFREPIKSIGQRPVDRLAVRELSQQVINHLLGGEFDLGFHPSVDERIARAFDYITQLPVKTIRLEDAARQVHLSPSRFRHLFKEDMGIDFRNLVMQLRFVEALKRANTEKNLTEIAHETGFTDLAHMTRVFKRVGGITPSSYINARNFLEVIYE